MENRDMYNNMKRQVKRLNNVKQKDVLEHKREKGRGAGGERGRGGEHESVVQEEEGMVKTRW